MCLVQIFFRQQNDNPVINFGQQLGVILNFIFRIWDVFGLILIVFGIEVVYEVDQLWLLSLKLDGFSDVEWWGLSLYPTLILLDFLIG